ncbi:MAG: hypothetical protein IKP47_01055 [Ruminococcus sp.]|nr:hypothetical protein [Ruminococcus sp.]
MGLDIYAGTMTRYYARNWLTSVQQWGLEHGMQVNIVRPEGQEDENIASPEEIIAGVTDWRRGLIEWLGDNIEGEPHWSEDNDATPYYTDKPDWDAAEALLLYACAKWLGKEPPATVRKNFDVYETELYKEFTERKQGAVSLFDSELWWLPLNDPLMFRVPLPTGQEKTLSTVGMLKLELDAINAIEWNASEEEIISWRDSEGYPDDAYYSKEKGLQMLEKHDEFDTVSLAKFAFSILWQAVTFAQEHGTCVIFDY